MAMQSLLTIVVILAVLLIFLNVEKNIDKEQAEIKARREAEE